MIAWAPWSRSACGLSSISRRPVLRVGLVPSTPMKDDSEATSSSSRIAVASACWRSAMAWNDTCAGASLMPWISPASCEGKKPLGTITYISAVSARVATTRPSISGCRARVQSSARSYSATTRSNMSPSAPLAWASASVAMPWSRPGLRKRAHSIGVSVSETTSEIAIATASVIANSWNRRPTTSPMNSSGISTAISDTVSEIRVKPICLAPSSAACSRGLPSSRCRATFSSITIASSTTKPVAMVSAIRVRLLSE